MKGTIVLPSPAIDRRESLLLKKKTESPAIPRQRRKKIGEVAGGAAAECTAVCCCCPCVLIDLLVLTVYRVPAGLWRKKKLRRQDALLQRPSTEPPSLTEAAEGDCASESTAAAEKEAAEAMERDTWAQFYGAGFWRSPSQRGA